jgi:hypothetical protein
MLDSDRRHLLIHGRMLMTRLIDAHDQLVSTLRTMHAGYPSGHEGVGEGSSRTETAALSRDPARADLKRVDKIVRSVHAQLEELDSLRESWLVLPDRPPAASPTGESGCELMARIGVWEPVFRSSDVNGNLPRPYRLCRFAYEWVRHQGRLPTREELQAHADGRRIRVKAG